MKDIYMFDCRTPKECRIVRNGGSTTLLAYTPEYDGFGREITVDPNTKTRVESCLTCGKVWNYTHKNGKTTVQEG